MPIRTVVWGENIHEQTNEIVRSIYPNGMHNTIAEAISADPAIAASTATLQEAEHGLPQARLDDTDLALAAERARAALQAAQARLALAEAQTRRARELQAQGFFSPEALAARETELALQRADVAQRETHADEVRAAVG